MAEHDWNSLIGGAGLAGAAAIGGIQEHDRDGSKTMIGAESHVPYHGQPLSKKLWSGKSEAIF